MRERKMEEAAGGREGREEPGRKIKQFERGWER